MTENSGDLILALDQGGQSSRALVFDETGQTVAVAQQSVHVSRYGEDRVEQDPIEVVESLRSAVREVIAKLGADRGRVRAAGLATQRSSLVCWRRGATEALSPILSWQDRRAAHWLDDFKGHAARVRALTGLMLSPHYGASKMRWCLDHLPEVRAARARRSLACGPLAGFLIASLVEGSPLFIDPANASRTLLYDGVRRTWSDELLALFGIPEEILPRCVPTVGAYGDLIVDDFRVPLVATNGDQPSALFAFGMPTTDAVYLNLGTGVFLQRVATAIDGVHDRLLTGIALDDGVEVTRVIEGTVNGGAAALSWLESKTGDPVAAQIDGLLEEATSPPLFLNGIGGLGSPFWIADFPSRWVEKAGAESSDRDARAVAVAESIVFLIRENLEIMQSGLAPIRGLHVSGGLARSGALCRRIAALADLPIMRPEETEATARGIAWIAARPRAWARERAGALFAAEEMPAFQKRYSQWRREMSRAIAKMER